MKCIFAVVVLAFAVSVNANSIQVVDIAKSGAPVGTWGPALVNLWGNSLGLGIPGTSLSQGLTRIGGIGGIGSIAGLGGLGVVNGIGLGGINGLGINSIGLGGINGLGINNIGLNGINGLGVANLGLGIAGPGIGIGGLGIVGDGIGIGHGHSGKYIAANRGSVHVAPLVGHIQSVKSANLQPAPGTIW